MTLEEFRATLGNANPPDVGPARYRRAHQPVAADSLKDEWNRIVNSLL